MKFNYSRAIHQSSIVCLMLLGPACASKQGKKSPPAPAVVSHPDDYEGYMMRPLNSGKGFPGLTFFANMPNDVKAIPYIDASPDKVVESILEHTYVSHAWMRERFRKAINAAPVELLRLASCTRLIVIDARSQSSSAGYETLTLAGAVLAASEAELATTRGSSYQSPGTGKRSFIWNTILSRTIPWVDAEAKNPEHTSFLKTITTLTHELIHTCDNKNYTKTGFELNSKLSPYLSQLPYDFFLSAYYGMKSVDGVETRHSFEEMGQAHMASAAADAYSYRGPLEQYAVLGERLLSRIFLGIDYYEYFAVTPLEGEKGGDKEMLWGVKNKFCSPQVYTEARKVIQTLGLYNELELPENIDCKAELMQSGVSVMDSLKNASSYTP